MTSWVVTMELSAMFMFELDVMLAWHDGMVAA